MSGGKMKIELIEVPETEKPVLRKRYGSNTASFRE